VIFNSNSTLEILGDSCPPGYNFNLQVNSLPTRYRTWNSGSGTLSRKSKGQIAHKAEWLIGLIFLNIKKPNKTCDWKKRITSSLPYNPFLVQQLLGDIRPKLPFEIRFKKWPKRAGGPKRAPASGLPVLAIFRHFVIQTHELLAFWVSVFRSKPKTPLGICWFTSILKFHRIIENIPKMFGKINKIKIWNIYPVECF
jgi:hypothetical protein